MRKAKEPKAKAPKAKAPKTKASKTKVSKAKVSKAKCPETEAVQQKNQKPGKTGRRENGVGGSGCQKG